MSVKFLKPCVSVRKKSLVGPNGSVNLLLVDKVPELVGKHLCDCVEITLHRAKTCIHHRKRVHKVHFTEEDDSFADHSAIAVQCIGDNKFAVHLGFLKLRHRYEIRFRITHRLGSVVQAVQESPNLHVKMMSIDRCDGSEYELKMEFFAHKEKLLKETLVLQDGATGKTISIVFHARVLGHGKGTPSLKSGIRCIGIERDDESEASDWQGFE